MHAVFATRERGELQEPGRLRLLAYGYACGLEDKIVGENDLRQDYIGIFTKSTDR
jgi:hypothetical protein